MYQLGESARQVAEASADELFAYIFRETANPFSTSSKWLIEGNSLEHPTFDNSTAIPAAKQHADAIAGGILIPEINISAKVIDFRNTDSRDNKYYGKEGVGTIELSVIVSLNRSSGGKKEVSYQLIRHHDFKIVTVTSAPSKRSTSYSHNFILDYVLFVRQGFKEFNEKFARPLNPNDVKIVIKQPTSGAKGKVFFGGTTQGRSVYLNVSANNKYANIFPQMAWTEMKRIDRDACLDLFPKVKEQITSQQRDKIAKLEGVFYAGTFPLIKPPAAGDLGNVEVLTLTSLWNSTSGNTRNENPGIEILSDDQTLAMNPDYAKSFLQGCIRQRFFYFAAFFLDISKLDSDVANQLKKYATWYPCITTPLPSTPVPPIEMTDFCNEMKNRYGSDGSLFSDFISDYPLYSGQTLGSPQPDFSLPAFFDSAGRPVNEDSTSFQAFNHVNLWSNRFVFKESLEKTGIINRSNATVNLRGFSWLGNSDDANEDRNIIVEIGEPGKTYKIRGRGGIILKAGSFKIKGSIKKESPGDLLILFTRNGNIDIETDEPVDAALIALGGGKPEGGHVIPRKRLDLTGMIASEWIDTDNWPKGVDNQIKYDELLMNGDQYCVNISSAISLQKISESR
ncbi:MAG: hypothetical protein HQM10_10630 [Candidatus Riflebacteria bacterium]|nr:hypothetical protein [Candidatus Riflebacteria bacterium]